MLRLALVITELEPGGAERCLTRMATGLDRSRYEPVVYSLAPRPAAGRDVLVRQLEEANVPVRFLGLRSQWQALGAVGKLAGQFRNERPEIVQTFLFHANVLGTLAARRANVPHVITGIRVADPRAWRWAVERWCTSRVDRIVCVSQSVADFCRVRCRFPSEKLVVIPNGVDTGRFQNLAPCDPAHLGLPAGRKWILYIGRLDRQKGLDVLLEAAAEFLQHLPEHDLLLVGEGPERAALERQAKCELLKGRVRFAGYRQDVPALLAAAELLVLPSRWEGMPNVVLEAMAAGKPVVATRAEGVLELLGESAENQTVPSGDAQALAQKISEIAQSSQLLKSLGASNFERARNRFSIPTMVGHYQALYEVVCDRARPSFFS